MRNRWRIVGLALVSAALFALSVQAGMWWSVGEASIGPFGTSMCGGGECRGTSLAWLGGSDLWMRSGTATWAAGWIAMVAMIALAAGVASRRVPRLAARACLSALATTIVCGGYFVLAFPNRYGATIDRGVYLFAAAVVVGLVATVGVLRAARAAARATG